MQRSLNVYNPRFHDRYRAIRMKQPYADAILDNEQRIIVMPSHTNHRGDTLIISDAGEGDRCGCAICLVDLYDTVRVDQMSEQDLMDTGYPPSGWEKLYGFGYRIRNPRPVIEIPLSGKPGVFSVILDKDDLTIYPAITDDEYNALVDKYFSAATKKKFKLGIAILVLVGIFVIAVAGLLVYLFA